LSKGGRAVTIIQSIWHARQYLRRDLYSVSFIRPESAQFETASLVINAIVLAVNSEFSGKKCSIGDVFCVFVSILIVPIASPDVFLSANKTTWPRSSISAN